MKWQLIILEKDGCIMEHMENIWERIVREIINVLEFLSTFFSLNCHFFINVLNFYFICSFK